MRRKSNRAENDFETQKEALLQEIRSVLGEVESLYEAGVERGEEEARELTAKLKQRLSNAQSKLQDFEERAVEQVKNSAKPPMNTSMKNRITPWALPRWRAWWSAYC